MRLAVLLATAASWQHPCLLPIAVDDSVFEVELYDADDDAAAAAAARPPARPPARSLDRPRLIHQH